MSYRNRILTGLFLCGTLLRTCASGQPLPPDSASLTNKSAPNVSLRGGETVGDHQVQRAFLTVGTNLIAFIVPTGFRMDASGANKLVFSDDSGDFFITVRLTSTTPPAGSEIDFFKNQALSHYPGARISNQFAAYAAGHSGQTFDLAWMNSNGGAQSARIAFVSSPAGTLEFSVLTRTVNFGDAQRYLTVLMSSVRSNETGKLIIKPLPDYS